MEEKNYFIESRDFMVIKIDSSKGFNLYCEDIKDLFDKVRHLIKEISMLGVKSLSETFVVELEKDDKKHSINCNYHTMTVNDFKEIFE